MSRKFVSVLLVLCMVLSLMPTAFAAGGEAAATELPEAVNGKITLEKDVVLSTTYEVSGDLTIDLATHTITGNDIRVFQVKKGTLTLTGSGTVTSVKAENGTLADSSSVIRVGDGNAWASASADTAEKAGLVIDAGVTITAPATYGVSAFGSATSETVTVKGKIHATDAAALAGNGMDKVTGTTITIEDGAKLTSESDAAIYHPQVGTLLVNGGTIKGATGIEMKAGTLNVTGEPTIEAIAAENHTPNSNGTSTRGYAVAVVQNNAYAGKPAANLAGGSYTGKVAIEDDNTVENDKAGSIRVTAGTFSSDVSAYVPDGYASTSADGSYTVGKKVSAGENDVAVVDGQYFSTLASAIAAAKDGKTVTLLKDIALASRIVVSGETTLDLNGYSITRGDGNQNSWLLGIVAGATLTIQDTSDKQSGEIYSANYPGINEKGEPVTYAGYPVLTNGTVCVKSGTIRGYYALRASGAGADMRVEGGALHGDYAAVVVQDHAAATISGENTTVSGRNGAIIYGVAASTEQPTALTIAGGKITAKDFAIAGNGTDDNTVITITGGEMTSEALGIYHPQVGDLTISGGKITAPNGVQYCGAGTLKMSGGEIIATAPYTEFPQKPSSQGDGSTSDGAALAIISRGGGYQNEGQSMHVEISGGILTSQNNAALSVYRLELVNNKWATNGDTNLSSFLDALTISGGQFSGDVRKGALEIDGAAAEAVAVSSGYFTSDPSAFVDGADAAVPSDKSGYDFMIGTKPDVTSAEILPATGEPDVTVNTDIADPDAAKAIAQSITDNGVLSAAANQIVADVTAEQKQAATDAIKDSNSGVDTTGKDIRLYAQTYLDVEAKEYDTASKTVTLDITPMYCVVASTAAAADEIQLDGKEKNAVVLEESRTELTNIKNIQITVGLPEGFVAAPDTQYYAKHIHNGNTYYYPLTIDDTNRTATFTNTRGFSLFALPVAEEPAASITVNGRKTLYDSLQNALEEVEDHGVITVYKDGLTGSLTTTKTVTLQNDSAAPIGVTVNEKAYTIAANGGTQEISYTAPAPTYSIAVPTVENGKVTVNPDSAAENSTVTITVTPDEGYMLSTLTVTDAQGNKITLMHQDDGTYTFTMPAAEVRIAASFAKIDEEDPVKDCPQDDSCPAVAFDDISKGAWYHDGVHFCVAQELMKGEGDNKFVPAGTLTRGMLVTILYRMDGAAAEGAPTFADVPADEWYADGVAWAAENGIVEGVGNNLYAPERNISRQDMATILYRYAKFKGCDVTDLDDLSTYGDAGKISDYAKVPFQWCVSAHIINGKPGNLIDPRGNATRAEVATVFMRYCASIEP